MILSEFINELKHKSVNIIIAKEYDYGEVIFSDTLGVLVHWVDYPKYMSKRITALHPMNNLTGFIVRLEV